MKIMAVGFRSYGRFLMHRIGILASDHNRRFLDGEGQDMLVTDSGGAERTSEMTPWWLTGAVCLRVTRGLLQQDRPT
jgi:hypothetical protein